MRKKLDYFFVGIVFLLGTIHTVGTILFQRSADLEFLMYVGTGLGFLMAASINLPVLKYSSRYSLIFALITNLAFSVFMIFVTIVITDVRAISVIIAFFWLFISTFVDMNNQKNG